MNVTEKTQARIVVASAQYAKSGTSLHALALGQAVEGLAESHKSQEAADAKALFAARVVSFLAAEKLGRAWLKGDEKTTAGKVWSDVWTITLKTYAHRGNMVFRGTEHVVAQIMAAKDAKRVDRVNLYLKESKGLEVVTGLAKVRKYGKLVLADLADNAASEIRTIAGMESAAGQLEAFAALWTERYGATLSSLVAAFKSDATPATAATFVEKAKELFAKSTDLAELDAAATALAERIAEIKAMQDALGGLGENETDESSEGEGEGERIAA